LKKSLDERRHRPPREVVSLAAPGNEIAKAGERCDLLVPGTTAGRSPHVLWTGTSRAFISECVY
jgi:hypothetical protein